MKNTEILKKIAMIAVVSLLIASVVLGLVMCGMGTTMAETESTASYLSELAIGETKTIKAGNAYAWKNTDPAVLELTSEKGEETATIKALKPGLATISAGTSVGQVLIFTYKVADKTSGGGDNGGDTGGDNGGGDNGGNGEKPLDWIPGLSSATNVDTVLNINGDEWIVLKNIEMEGSRYAMLLKKTALPQKCYSLSGESYAGSNLHSEMNKAYSSSYIPEPLMNNAVVPKLGDDSASAVSAPTSKMAAASGTTKDIIFPLSYKEATDWGGSATSSKLNMGRQRWWLRTPNGSQWHYVISHSDIPDSGTIISTPTIAINGNELYLRPAIWVKYLEPLG